MILLFSISLFTFVTYAYFTDLLSETFSGEMGFVDIDLYAYFDDGSGGEIEAQEVVVDSNNQMTGTDVSFVSSTKTISSSSLDLSVFQDGDKLRVVGSSSNDGYYTVSGTPTANSLVVLESITDESAGASVTMDSIITKPGIYYINIVSSGNDFFFEDFRLHVDVLSNIDTYVRIKIYEQLTLTYTDYQGQVTELSILFDGYMPFEYDTTNWYDNRTYDNYIYYKTAVQRVNETTPLDIGLIPTYIGAAYYYNIDSDIANSNGTVAYSYVSPGVYSDGVDTFNIDSNGNLVDGSLNVIIPSYLIFNTEEEANTYPIFSTYTAGYSLQIGFSVEAVQSDGGPENVWELTTPPWGGSW